MIIRNDRTRTLSWKRLAAAGLIGLTFALALGWAYRSYRNRWREGTVIACDMETVVEADGQKFFMAGDVRLGNGHTQVLGHARSGTHACLVHSKQEYGVTYETDTLLPGAQYEVTIWRQQADHHGFLVSDANWGEYKQGVFSGREEPGGWEELVVRVQVPMYAQNAKVKFYAWNTTEDSAYFDDMAVRQVLPGESGRIGGFAASDSVPSINLQIDQADWQKLQGIRERALHKGILEAGSDEWVTAILGDGKQQLPSRVRLKGDWTDHLVGDKWSFRIALDEGFAWNHMRTFSVQNPITRDYLSEWVYHQWLKQEDILTPRYGFVELRINGISKGLYAYEEHFDKQLLEFNSRREGPILKFDEEGLWEVQGPALAAEMMDLETHVPAYKASDILPFGSKAVLKDSSLMRQFRIAQQLILQYKTGQKNVWEMFDAPKVARYYAIIDMLNAQHGLIWHNQRWYYNPVLSRMEPIGFDGFTEFGPLVWIDRPIIGFARNVRYMAPGYREMMFERFFHDRAFVKLYVEALDRYTQPGYLDQFYRSIASELRQYEAWMRHELPDYVFNTKLLYDRAKTLHILITPMERSSVKAYLQGKDDRGYHYRVYNYHCLPVELTGVGKSKEAPEAKFSDAMLLDAYNNEFPAEYIDAWSAEEGKYIFFEVPGLKGSFHAEIMPWAQPEGNTGSQELFANLHLVSNEIYQVDSVAKRVTFRPGNHQTSRDLLFPAGYEIRFEEGTNLDLIGGAKFISKSKVLMFGDDERPIVIRSSDGSAGGFTVLQAEGKSELHYVVFEKLRALHDRGWNLTGAVTFYESEMWMERCRIVECDAPDAVNVIRTVFTMDHSYIGYAKGDGLDADYCHGSITQLTILNPGKDGIECTGGHVRMDLVTVTQAGERGIAMLEDCHATIDLATVEDCPVGLAAEDLSAVDVTYIILNRNALGLQLAQTKPEYGPAHVVVKQHRGEGNAEQYKIGPGSTLSLDGQLIEGKR